MGLLQYDDKVVLASTIAVIVLKWQCLLKITERTHAMEWIWIHVDPCGVYFHADKVSLLLRSDAMVTQASVSRLAVIQLPVIVMVFHMDDPLPCHAPSVFRGKYPFYISGRTSL